MNREKLLRKEVSSARQALIDAERDLAAYLAERDAPSEAIEEYRQLIPLERLQFGVHSTEVADSLNQLGNVLYDSGDLAAARESYESSLEIQLRIYGEAAPELFITLQNLISVLVDAGLNEEALSLCYKLVVVAETKLRRAVRTRKDEAEAKLSLADGCLALGDALIRNGRSASAIYQILRSIDLHGQLGTRPRDGLLQVCELLSVACESLTEPPLPGEVLPLIDQLTALHAKWKEPKFIELAATILSALLSKADKKQLADPENLAALLRKVALLASSVTVAGGMVGENLEVLESLLRAYRLDLVAARPSWKSSPSLEAALQEMMEATRLSRPLTVPLRREAAELLARLRPEQKSPDHRVTASETPSQPPELRLEEKPGTVAHKTISSWHRRIEKDPRGLETSIEDCIVGLGRSLEASLTTTSKIRAAVLRECGELLWGNGIETDPDLRWAERPWHRKEKLRLRRRTWKWPPLKPERLEQSPAADSAQDGHDAVEAIVELGMLVARADRVLHPDEEKLIRRHAVESLRRSGGFGDGVEDLVRAKSEGHQGMVAVIADRLNSRLTTEQRGELLQHLFAVALADGHFAPEEEAILKRLDVALRTSSTHFARLLRDARRFSPRTSSKKAVILSESARVAAANNPPQPNGEATSAEDAASSSSVAPVLDDHRRSIMAMLFAD